MATASELGWVRNEPHSFPIYQPSESLKLTDRATLHIQEGFTRGMWGTLTIRIGELPTNFHDARPGAIRLAMVETESALARLRELAGAGAVQGETA